MVSLDVQVRGTKEVKQNLEQAAHRIADMRPAYELVHADYQETMKRAFRLGGSPVKWAPLSPRYAEWKRRHHPGRPTLVLSGEMRDSLAARNRFSVAKISQREALFSTSAPHAHLHQRGGKKLPQRKVVQITNAVKNRWRRIMHDWVVERLQGSLSGEGKLSLRVGARGLTKRVKPAAAGPGA